MSQPDYCVVTLRTASGSELELLPAAGGLTNRLRFCGAGRSFEVIEGFANRQAIANDTIYRGVPLFPVVNRLADGRYTHGGKTYQLPVNEPARNNTLHGFLPQLAPSVEVTQSDDSSIGTLTYRYRGEFSGYPFPADVQFVFTLSDDASLEVRMNVVNLHHQPIPVGIGWHPYFSLDGRVDNLALQLPKVDQVLVNERMLPTGEQTEYCEFSRSKIIGATEFDNCFAIQHIGLEDIVTTRLWSEGSAAGLEVWQQTGPQGLNYLQICTAPDRRSIAIEPVSCGIDAFNTGEGLVILEPNQRFSSRAGVRLIN